MVGASGRRRNSALLAGGATLLAFLVAKHVYYSEGLLPGLGPPTGDVELAFHLLESAPLLLTMAGLLALDRQWRLGRLARAGVAVAELGLVLVVVVHTVEHLATPIVVGGPAGGVKLLPYVYLASWAVVGAGLLVVGLGTYGPPSIPAPLSVALLLALPLGGLFGAAVYAVGVESFGDGYKLVVATALTVAGYSLRSATTALGSGRREPAG